jgi:hypothetical protein
VTVHVTAAGVGSVFPTSSVALAWKVCEPADSPVSVVGSAQALNGAVSSAQVNVAPASSEARSMVADVELESCGALTIVVSGGVVSMTHATECDALSVSVAAVTSNEWAPGARSAYETGD